MANFFPSDLYTTNENNTHSFAKIYHDATKATRKYSGDPYIVHPEGVAAILKSLGANEDLVQAGLCHDLLEDTEVTWDELKDNVNENVADIVEEVTTDEFIKEKFGKEIAIDKELLHLSNEALALKLADQLYNYSDHADEKQKKRIKHHIKFIKQNRKLKSIHKELIEMLESMFEYI
jgi:GTP pyrophosphokinase